MGRTWSSEYLLQRYRCEGCALWEGPRCSTFTHLQSLPRVGPCKCGVCVLNAGHPSPLVKKLPEAVPSTVRASCTAQRLGPVITLPPASPITGLTAGDQAPLRVTPVSISPEGAGPGVSL